MTMMHRPREPADHFRGEDLRRYRLIMFGVAAVAAVVVVWNALDQYFLVDSWDYWTTRQDYLAEAWPKGLIKALFVAFAGVVETPIVLVLMAGDALFGLRVYWPYLIPVVALHLASGILLFEVLVRRIRPAIAVAAGALYLVMGHAGPAVATATFVMVMMGIAAIWLAVLAIERWEGTHDRRLMSVVLVASLLSSLAGLAAIFVACFLLVSRGRHRLAAGLGLTFTGLLAGARLLLLLFSNAPGSVGTPDRAWISLDPRILPDYVRYLWKGLTMTTEGLIATGWTPLVILAFAGVGWAAATTFRRSPRDPLYAATAAAAIFWYALLGARAAGAATGPVSAGKPHYMMYAAALLLPSLAWIADRLVDRHLLFAIPLTLGIAWSMYFNASEMLRVTELRGEIGQANRVTIETAASLRGNLDSLEAGFLVADGSWRFTVPQFERLLERGKVPCVADYDNAIRFADEQYMPRPSPEDVRCDG